MPANMRTESQFFAPVDDVVDVVVDVTPLLQPKTKSIIDELLESCEAEK